MRNLAWGSLGGRVDEVAGQKWLEIPPQKKMLKTLPSGSGSTLKVDAPRPEKVWFRMRGVSIFTNPPGFPKVSEKSGSRPPLGLHLAPLWHPLGSLLRSPWALAQCFRAWGCAQGAVF